MTIFQGTCFVCQSYEAKLRKFMMGPSPQWVEDRIASLLVDESQILELADEEKEKDRLVVEDKYKIFTSAHRWLQEPVVAAEHHNYNRYETLLELDDDIDDVHQLFLYWISNAWVGGTDFEFSLEQLEVIRARCWNDMIVL